MDHKRIVTIFLFFIIIPIVIIYYRFLYQCFTDVRSKLLPIIFRVIRIYLFRSLFFSNLLVSVFC